MGMRARRSRKLRNQLIHALHGNPFQESMWRTCASSVSLPTHWRLILSQPDGDCLFHAFFDSLHERRSTSAWSLDSLKNASGIKEGEVGNIHHLKALTVALHLQVVVVPCQMSLNSTPEWKGAFHVGSLDDPCLYLLWWYDDVSKSGLHFDLLEPIDTLATKNFLELKRLARHHGIHIYKHTKRVHLMLALREPPPGLKVAPPRVGPLHCPIGRKGQRMVLGLRILQWNVTSLRSRRHDLSRVIRETSPHVIALQETWAKDAEALQIPHYTLVSWSARPASTKGGGVALYAQEELVSHPLEVPSAIHCELCCGRVVLQGSAVTILTGYIPPPSSSYAPKTMDDITELFANALSQRPDVVCGDFNCEASSDMTGARFDHLTELCQTVDVHDLEIPEPTFRKAVSMTTPDVYCTTTRLEFQTQLDVLPQLTAEHCPILATVGTPSCRPRCKRPIRWRMQKANFEKYRRLLLDARSKWSVFRTGQASVDYNQFVATILAAAKQSIPLGRGKKRAFHSWNHHCADLYAQQRALQQQPPHTTQEEYRAECELVRTSLKHAMMQCRIDSWKTFTDELCKDTTTGATTMTRAYALSRSMLGKSKPRGLPALRHGSRFITSGKGRAQLLANTFSQTCQPLPQHRRAYAQHHRKIRRQVRQYAAISSGMVVHISKSEIKKVTKYLRMKTLCCSSRGRVLLRSSLWLYS